MWYNDWFKDANYLTVYEHRDDEEAECMMDLIEDTIGHDTNRSVFDLACGSGRHSIAFAKRGYKKVVGVDLSTMLLEQARDAAREFGFSMTFEERDMRDLPKDRYDLVVNLFTSFGYFKSDEENERVIRGVADSLRSEGYFVLDFLNAAWVKSHLVAHDERVLTDGQRLQQFRWIENGRVEKRILIRDRVEAHEYVESVRLFILDDFKEMFARSGLKLEKVFGNYFGSQFDEMKSPRMIMFAKK